MVSGTGWLCRKRDRNHAILIGAHENPSQDAQPTKDARSARRSMCTMAPHSAPSPALNDLVNYLRALPTVADPLLHRDEELAGDMPALPLLPLLAQLRDRLTSPHAPTRAA